MWLHVGIVQWHIGPLPWVQDTENVFCLLQLLCEGTQRGKIPVLLIHDISCRQTVLRWSLHLHGLLGIDVGGVHAGKEGVASHVEKWVLLSL